MARNSKNQANELPSAKRLRTWIETILNSNKTIYVILFFAYFHAVFRIPFVGSLTFFRILIPLSVLIVGKHSLKLLKGLIYAVGSVVLLSAVQGFLCQKLYYPDLVFSVRNMAEFWFHYASLLILGSLLMTLWSKEGEVFYKNFSTFNTIIIECAMVCNTVWLLFGGNYTNFHLFGNINNFGCAIVVGVALILCSESKMHWKCIWTGMAVMLLYANDSKVALLGLLLELGIYLLVWIEKNIINTNRATKSKLIRFIFKNWRGMYTVTFVLTLTILLLSPLSINGYSLREITVGALDQVFGGRYYEHSTSSIQFRVNAIIGLGDILKESYLLGVGTGNSGMILRQILPDMNVMYEGHNFISSHIWWLELFSDFGLLLMIPTILIFVSQLVCFFKCSYRSSFSLLQTMILVSFPVWSMSAAGLYTDFYSLSVVIVAAIGTARILCSRWRNKKKISDL